MVASDQALVVQKARATEQTLDLNSLLRTVVRRRATY
jgi:hypothetical protein